MAVSSGNLDSLLNLSFPFADLTSVDAKSWTGSPPTPTAPGTVSTVTLRTSGKPPPGGTTGESFKVVAVNDALNAITLSVLFDGTQVAQETEFVIGFSPQSILISGDNANTDAGLFNAGQFSRFDDVSAVLSTAPLPDETNITYSFAATSALTPATPAPPPVSAPPPTPTATPTPPPVSPPTPTATPTPPPVSTPPAVSPPTSTPGLAVFDTTAAQPVSAVAQPYTGPVAGLQQQLVDITADSLNITVTTPNWFIHSGTGTDAINVSQAGGNNVLDGSTGSNFLTGGSGNDTFFLDDRKPTADVFSTVVGFHSGDNATVFGVNRTDFTLTMLDNQGAAGFTGLDFQFSAPGRPNASLVLTGLTTADLSNGRLTATFGTTADLPGVPGSQFLNIHAN
jgi:hypothetical protein